MPRVRKKPSCLTSVSESVKRIRQEAGKLIAIDACPTCATLKKTNSALPPTIRTFAFCTVLDDDDDMTGSHVIVGRKALSGLSSPRVDTTGEDQHPFIVASLLANEVTNVLAQFGLKVVVLKKEVKVLVLAYCNCWHSLKKAHQSDNLTLPTGIAFSDVHAASTSDGSGQAYDLALKKMLARELNDAVANEEKEKERNKRLLDKKLKRRLEGVDNNNSADELSPVVKSPKKTLKPSSQSTMHLSSTPKASEKHHSRVGVSSPIKKSDDGDISESELDVSRGSVDYRSVLAILPSSPEIVKETETARVVGTPVQTKVAGSVQTTRMQNRGTILNQDLQTMNRIYEREESMPSVELPKLPHHQGVTNGNEGIHGQRKENTTGVELGIAEEMQREPTIWSRTSVHDYRDAVAVIASHAQLYEESAGLESTCKEALKEIDVSIRTSNYRGLEPRWDEFLPALKKLIEKVALIKERHEKVQTGLIFTCAAYKMRAREAERLVKLQAVMASSGVNAAKVLREELDDDDEKDARNALFKFAERMEEDRCTGELPFDWNPRKNKAVGMKSLGLHKFLQWPAGIEEYAENYIGSQGHLVPEDKRGQDDLEPFVTVVTVRTARSIGLTFVYVGHHIWLQDTFLDELNTLFEQCITRIIMPALLAQTVNQFVDRFMRQEMPSPVEQWNYWGSFYNPVARKKTTLILDMVTQFSIELNRNYRLNGIPLVSSAEVNMVATAITRRLNKVCADKRKYRLSQGDCVPAYNYNNQLDFYYPTKDVADEKLLTDAFIVAFTKMEDVRQDSLCTRFRERAKNLKTKSRTHVYPKTAVSSVDDNILKDYFERWKREDRQTAVASSDKIPAWISVEKSTDARRNERWAEVIKFRTKQAQADQLKKCLSALRENEKQREEVQTTMRKEGRTKKNPARITEEREKRKKTRDASTASRAVEQAPLDCQTTSKSRQRKERGRGQAHKTLNFTGASGSAVRGDIRQDSNVQSIMLSDISEEESPRIPRKVATTRQSYIDHESEGEVETNKRTDEPQKNLVRRRKSDKNLMGTIEATE